MATVKIDSVWMLDAAERVFFTFAEAFLAYLLVPVQAGEPVTLHLLKVAAVAALLAVVKAFGARFVGSPDSASVLK